MKYSLVLATLNRVDELERFFEALLNQTYQDFELVLVDQNTDGRIDPLVNRYQALFPLIHLHSAPGLSRARNVGLQSISGDIVAFPDDDCWYPPGLLEQVASLLNGNPDWDGVTGIARGDGNGPSRFKWDAQPGPITKYNVWKRGVSISLFLQRKVVQAVGYFDERLGLGAGTPWGSGEETDYLLRAEGAGMVIMYQPDLVVHHDDSLLDYGDEDVRKARLYGGGMGFVMRKHGYPIHWVVIEFVRPLVIAFISMLNFKMARSEYFFFVFSGRLKGYTGSKVPKQMVLVQSNKR